MLIHSEYFLHLMSSTVLMRKNGSYHDLTQLLHGLIFVTLETEV